MLRLRDEHPDDLAAGIWSPGAVVQNRAIAELLLHGNMQKAALVVRGLLKEHPVCEKTVREHFGELANQLLTGDIRKMPKGLSQFKGRR